MQELLKADSDVDAQGGWCANALQAALFRGYIKISEILID
jgi:hypothetical protein